MTIDTLLIDFGGVLTTSVLDSFARFCLAEGLPADAVLRCVSADETGRRLLVEVEEGRLASREFELAFADLLSTNYGRPIESDDLLARLNEGLAPEPLLIEATASLRRAGVTTVLISNSLGEAPYAWCDFDLLFDHVVLSGRVGMRKPSRSIFRHALELSDRDPQRCVMVDDLEQNLRGAARLQIGTLLHCDGARTVAALEDLFGVRDLVPGRPGSTGQLR